MNDKRISAAEFDRRFEKGKELSSDRRPNLETKRVNVDFPPWLADRLKPERRVTP